MLKAREAHAQTLQGPALFGAASARALRLHLLAVQHAELLDELIGQAASQSFEPSVAMASFILLEDEQPTAGLGCDEGLQSPGGPLGAPQQDHASPKRRTLGETARRR